MRNILIIFFMSITFVSCSIYSAVGGEIPSKEEDYYVTEIPEEVRDSSREDKPETSMADDCFYNEHVKYNPILENACSDDQRLYVFFNLYADTIIDDTIKIKKIEIDEIRDKDRKVVDRKDCEDYFLSQLYQKTYVYKCYVKGFKLECRAIKRPGDGKQENGN